MTLNVWEGRGGDRGEVYKGAPKGKEVEHLCDPERVGGEGRRGDGRGGEGRGGEGT